MKITLKDGSVKEYAESKSIIEIAADISAVSYTHLDVYKRQVRLPELQQNNKKTESVCRQDTFRFWPYML